MLQSKLDTSNVVVSKSSDKRSTHFDAKLLQITGTEFVGWGRRSKVPNELSAIHLTLNDRQTYLSREVVAAGLAPP
jgi:hypothetical protein